MVALVGDITNRYIQVKITLTSSDGVSNPSVADYQFDYMKDMDDPTNPDTVNGYSENGGDAITTDTWYNHTGPYFTWSGDDDSDSGMSGGYAGYWVCFGAVDCEPTSGTLRTTATYTASSLVDGTTYYLRIKARDAAGQVTDSAWTAFIYKYDGTEPTNPGVVAADPAGYTNNQDNFTFLWSAGSDAHSGIDQYCYKTGVAGATDTCISETTISSIEAYQEGINKFYVRSKDVAGNVNSSYTSVQYYWSASAPSEPTDLAVDPEISTTNSFTLSWNEPDTHENDIAGYYYSVNQEPTADNSTYTTSTEVSGAFATRQGLNTFYVVAIDEVDNIEWTAYSSVDFTATTTAPGIPQGVIVTDTSSQELETYSLTVTWNTPSFGTVDHYNVNRSEDDSDTYAEISQVTGTGYLDTGLTQNAWYCYRITAVDNAEATSALSTEVCEQARGRYYEPPNLVGNPGAATRIQSAVVEWLTDREGSSFVEYGTTTSYGNEQGQADSVTSHEVTLVGLKPNTVYHYRTKWTDSDSNTGYSTDYTFTTEDAPSAPTNLAVTPTSNTTNSFKFTWGAPVDEGVTIEGYFYSVNSTPTETNTSYTTQTTLGPGAYATQQGDNTFYVVAVDDASNVNYDNYDSVNFEAHTASPPVPTGMIITDSSNRERQSYTITIVWDPLTSASSYGAQATDEEIAYVIERSIDDDDSFTQIAETETYGYLDVGLDNTKTYYYRVKAKDTAGATSAASETVSEIPEGRYTTPPAITEAPAVAVDSFSATVTWKTERPCSSFVDFGLTQDEYTEEQGTSDLVEDHSVTVEGLDPETTYYYQVKTIDVDGNVSYSSVTSFVTLEAPKVSEMEVTDIRLYDATVTWKTNKETTTQLQYGTTTDYGLTYTDTSGSTSFNHSVKLSNLADGTTYHLRVFAEDAAGNRFNSDDYILTTLTFPRVLSVTSENKAEGQTEIQWTTNVPTTSEVEYYNEDTPSKTQGNTALVTNHAVLVFGLEDATTYQFVARGRDQFGYEAVSTEESFTTLEDTTPPIISDVRYEANTVGSGDAASVQIIASWTTNEPTAGQLEYGEGLSSSSYSASTDVNPELVIDHIMIIKDLEPARTYHFRVVATDKADNQTNSDSYSVLTSRRRESFLQIVISNLQDTFSWMSSMGNLF